MNNGGQRSHMSTGPERQSAYSWSPDTSRGTRCLRELPGKPSISWSVPSRAGGLRPMGALKNHMSTMTDTIM